MKNCILHLTLLEICPIAKFFFEDFNCSYKSYLTVLPEELSFVHLVKALEVVQDQF